MKWRAMIDRPGEHTRSGTLWAYAAPKPPDYCWGVGTWDAKTDSGTAPTLDQAKAAAEAALAKVRQGEG